MTSIVKVYVDNDIVSTLRRRDPSRPDYDAILELKRRSDRREITVFVSDVHDREATRLRADRQQAQQEVLAISRRRCFARWRTSSGISRSVVQPQRRLHSAAGSCPPARPPAQQFRLVGTGT